MNWTEADVVNCHNGIVGIGTAAPAVKFEVDGPIRVRPNVKAALPAGQAINNDDEAGGAVIAFSDGSNWRRVTDRAFVS